MLEVLAGTAYLQADRHILISLRYATKRDNFVPGLVLAS